MPPKEPNEEQQSQTSTNNANNDILNKIMDKLDQLDSRMEQQDIRMEQHSQALQDIRSTLNEHTTQIGILHNTEQAMLPEAATNIKNIIQEQKLEREEIEKLKQADAQEKKK